MELAKRFNHTDEELIVLENLTGRLPPFTSNGAMATASSMSSILIRECLVNSLDGRNQDADVFAAQLRIDFMDNAMGKKVDRCACPVMPVVEQVIDMRAGFGVYGAQVGVAAAFAGNLGFCILIHDYSPLDFYARCLALFSLVFLSDISRLPWPEIHMTDN
jgi:hypothetical protein